MMRCALALLALLVSAAPSTSVWAQAGQPGEAFPLRIAPDAVEFTLGNGLQVVAIPDRRAPVVTHMVWYRVGAADETAGQSGIAHFLEHLMFKGTPANPGNALDRRVESLGGDQNAFTSADYTAYFQRVAKENLAEMMRLEADRMTNLLLTDAVVAPERDVVLNERREEIEQNPDAVLNEQLLRLLYMNHPYGRPVIGWDHEIRALDREAALDFYKRYYTPNNAVVVVVGDVSPEEVRRLAEDTYGKVAARPEAVRAPRPAEPPGIGLRTVTVRDEKVSEPQVERAYIVPSDLTAEPGESEALSLLAEILGGGATSRYYDQLVRGDGPATEARAFSQTGGVDNGRFVLYGRPKPGVDLRALEARMQELLADLQDNGVSEAELARAKLSVIADQVYEFDDQEVLATAAGEALTLGLSLKDLQDWPARIQAVTAAQIKQVAEKYLRPEASATGYLEQPLAGEP